MDQTRSFSRGVSELLPDPHGGKLVSIPALNGADPNDGLVLDVGDSIATSVQLMRTGVYSPLGGFSCREDYTSILDSQRLADGIPWPIPLLLDSAKDAAGEGDEIFLRHGGKVIARVKVEEVFPFEKRRFCERVFGTNSIEHPGVDATYRLGDFLISGRILNADDPGLPHSGSFMRPADTRKAFTERGWKTVAAFQTRNVPHMGHEYLQKASLNITDGIFINPVIGKKKAGDFNDDLIVSAYSALVSEYFPNNRAVVSTVNYQMQYAGPREALLHAIMRKNFGCTHFIMGRDHAGVGNFYGPYDAQRNVMSFDDLGISVIPFEEAVYCRKCQWITSVKSCPHNGSDLLRFSATMVRNSLRNGEEPPSTIMRRDIWKMISSHPSPFVA